MSSNFSWYELHTPDAGKAETFYKGVFNWNMRDSGMPGGSYTLIHVGDAAIAGMMQKPAESFTGGAKPGWIGYIGVNNADEFAKRVQQAGGTVHKAPADIPGVGRFAVVADPQGAVFVLFQPMGGQPPEGPKPGTPGTPAWHDLAAIDWESDFTFYSELFGWTKSDVVPMGPNGVYQVFAVDSKPIGGMMTRMDPSQSPGWLFYFHVEDIQKAIARVNQQGGKVVHGPSEVPGGEQIAHCLDPQGAIFGMVAPKS